MNAQRLQGCRGRGLTIADLIFGNLALLLDVETADEEMPFALKSGGSSDADLCGGRWRQALYACDSHKFFARLFHLDTSKICRHIAVVVQRALDFIK